MINARDPSDSAPVDGRGHPRRRSNIQLADDAHNIDVDLDEVPADEEPDVEPQPELYYSDVVAFVSAQLAPTYRRSLGSNSSTWCPEWWRHAEAIARLEALWRAWEHLRLDPATGMSVWFRDHADHHMAVLLSADGPFKGCSPTRATRRGRSRRCR